jgi:hypothetical protein
VRSRLDRSGSEPRDSRAPCALDPEVIFPPSFVQTVGREWARFSLDGPVDVRSLPRLVGGAPPAMGEVKQRTRRRCGSS